MQQYSRESALIILLIFFLLPNGRDVQCNIYYVPWFRWCLQESLRAQGLCSEACFRGVLAGNVVPPGGDGLLVSPHTVLTSYTALLLHIWTVCSCSA